MRKELKVLAIDDHKSVLEVYAIIFSSFSTKFGMPEFYDVTDCRLAYQAIEDNLDNPFDAAVIDYNLPKWEKRHLYSGLDIAMHLRLRMPECKIIFITMQQDEDIIKNVLQNIKPEGFVHKIDCNLSELTEGVKQVLYGETFYSKSIAEYVLPSKKDSCSIDS